MDLLSDKIRACKLGAVDNPYQGPGKRVLFVCTLGILRSATAASMYAHRHNVRSCGSSLEDALIPISQRLIAWADEIVFMHPKNHTEALKHFPALAQFTERIKILNIPDKYTYRNKTLCNHIKNQYEPIRISRKTKNPG